MRQVQWFSLFFTFCLGFLLVLLTGCQTTLVNDVGDLQQQIHQRGYALVGVKFDSPPFGYLDADGEVKGYEIDLATELVRRVLGTATNVKFVQVNSSTRIAALQAKQVDFVVATMTITPERAKQVDFSPSYYQAAQGLMVPTGSHVQKPSDLADKPIAFVLGSTTQLHLKDEFPKATLLGFKSATEAFGAFQAGRTDAFSTDDAILNGFLQAHCGVRILPDKLSKEPYGIAFRRERQSLALRLQIEKTLEDLKKSGYFETLDKKWHQKSPPSYCGKSPAA